MPQQFNRILVCDDLAMTVAPLLYALRAAGYEVIFTDDAENVLKRARDERVDLIILDMDLGPKTQLDGAKLLVLERQQNPTWDIPIFGITGVWEGYKEAALKQGFLRFYYKPFEPSDIVKEVSRVLDERMKAQRGMTRWLKLSGDDEWQVLDLSVDPQKVRLLSNLIHQEVPLQLERNDLLLGHRLIGTGPLGKTLGIFYEILGPRMYAYLFPAQVNVAFQQHRLLSRFARTPYRLQLRVSDPLMADLPWELCRYSDVGGSDGLHWLGGDQLGSCVRLVPHSARLQSDEALQSPLKILVVGASPKGHPQLDLAGELQLIRKAFEIADVEWRVLGPPNLDDVANDVQWVGEATVTNVGMQIDKFKPAILHFMAHGSADDRGTVYLEDNDQPKPLGDYLLGMKLSDGSVRLLVLNCCLSASSARGIGGLAQRAAQANVAAVVGHLYPVADSAAKRFAELLYTEMAAGEAIDSAVQNARRRTWEEALENGLACLPILYVTGNYIRIGPGSSS
jgi:two-component system, cell cycle response regulator DivK